MEIVAIISMVVTGVSIVITLLYKNRNKKLKQKLEKCINNCSNKCVVNIKRR